MSCAAASWGGPRVHCAEGKCGGWSSVGLFSMAMRSLFNKKPLFEELLESPVTSKKVFTHDAEFSTIYSPSG